VEDQQPAAGDLTDEIPDHQSGDDASVDTDVAEAETAQRESDASEAKSTIDSAEGDETDEGNPEDEEPTAEDTADEGTITFRQRRPAGKWSIIAAAVTAVIFVGSAAFAGATVQPYLAERATMATKLRIARTADRAITTLWTYNPKTVDTLADRAAQYLSGDFEDGYRKFVESFAASSKQAQVENSTVVTGVAVESLKGPDATVLVYTNTTSTTPATKDMPSLKYLSYGLTMKRDHARWLVTRMTTITSLDLTPKF
jgi:Mce-associated membrane protein